MEPVFRIIRYQSVVSVCTGRFTFFNNRFLQLVPCRRGYNHFQRIHVQRCVQSYFWSVCRISGLGIILCDSKLDTRLLSV